MSATVPAATLAGSRDGLRVLQRLVTEILEVLAAEADRRTGPLPAGGPAAFRAALDELPDCLIPERGVDPVDVIRMLTRATSRWAVDFTNPGALARMQCPPLAVAAASELAVSTLNQGLQAWESGPFTALVEQRLIADLARLVGYPRGADGSVTSGGSVSNLMGLLVARDKAIKRHCGIDASRDGLCTSPVVPRVLCASGTHASVRRAARITGLGSQAILEVDSDSHGRMNPAAARRALVNLADHEVAVALIATAGTTDFGAFDPLDELAEIAREHDVWLHVDAAYGIGAAFSSELEHLTAGLQRSDSIALDLHKFGWAPASAGVFLTRTAEALEPIREHAAYLSTPEDEEVGLGTVASPSLQTTRRADAVKIAAATLALGRRGIEQLVDHCHALALHAADVIDADPRLELVAEPSFTTVVFRCPGNAWLPGLNASVRHRLIHDGSVLIARAVVAAATVGAEDYLKLVLLNPALTTAQLDETIDKIGAAADAVTRRGLDRRGS